jgi:hypothetical protein
MYILGTAAGALGFKKHRRGDCQQIGTELALPRLKSRYPFSNHQYWKKETRNVNS